MIAPVMPRKRKATSADRPKRQGLRGLLYSSQEQRAAKQVLAALDASSVTVILDRERAEKVVAGVMAVVMADARSMQATVSQIGSRKESSESRQRRLILLHGWLDRNMDRFKGRLDKCAEAAVKEVRGLGWSYSSIRREISSYRTRRKLDGC
jgi:hypothetical protein